MILLHRTVKYAFNRNMIAIDLKIKIKFIPKRLYENELNFLYSRKYINKVFYFTLGSKLAHIELMRLGISQLYRKLTQIIGTKAGMGKELF